MADQNTPDFDNMSQEEIMRWMESLAKRQGADEGFTTAADLEVEEIDPDSVDQSQIGEYIPHGWTKQQWEEQLAKEEAEKAAKRAAQQQAASAPPPPSQPATATPPPAEPAQPAAAVASDGTPDFDNMSQEEIMRWMESLAKRQGADEGFTTAADLEVAEVDPNSIDQTQIGEYIPHGWTKQQWEEQLAKEEAEKAAKRAAREQAAQAQPPAQPVQSQSPAQPPAPPAAPATPPPAEPAQPAAAAASGGTPDFDNMSQEEIMRWMESLAKRQGADEGFTTAADLEVEEVDPNSVDQSQIGEYIPHGMTKQQWQEQLAREETEKAAKRAAREQAAQAQQPPAQEPEPEEPAAAMPSFDDLFGELGQGPELPPLEDDIYEDGIDEDDIETVQFDLSGLDAAIASEGAEDDDDPMSWLAGLAADSDDAMPEFDLSGLDNDALSGLSDIPDLSGVEYEDEDDYDDDGAYAADDFPAVEPMADPMDWLTGLTDSTDDDVYDEEYDETYDEDDYEEAEPASADADSMQWLESLARNQGADEEELTTAAPDFDIDEDSAGDTGDFDFAAMLQGTGGQALDDTETADADDFADPGDWLDQLAAAGGAGLSGDRGRVGLGDNDTYADDVDDEAFKEASRSGSLSPDTVQKFFEQALERGLSRDDVEDYIENEAEEGDAEVVPADIPEWLLEQMGGPPDDSDIAAQEADEEPDMVDDIASVMDVDEDIISDMPDWLTEDLEPEADLNETGDLSDIFAEAKSDEMSEFDALTEEQLPEPVMDVDTDDPWVEAFVLENEKSEEMASWYNKRLQAIQGDDIAEAEEEVADVTGQSLRVAELEPEYDLPHGQPETVPGWLGDVTGDTADIVAMPELDVVDDIPGWVDSDDAADEDLPGWLKTQVDDMDELDLADDMPDWIRETGDEDLDIAPEDIPDWLRETMREESETVQETPQLQPPQPAQVEPPKPVPAASSPAPVPMQARQIDVAATLQSARQNLGAGNIEAAMVDYETVVRANTALDTVVDDLRKLTAQDAYKKNPAAHRVLGDALMRQGSLQEALDMYRNALKML